MGLASSVFLLRFGSWFFFDRRWDFCKFGFDFRQRVLSQVCSENRIVVFFVWGGLRFSLKMLYESPGGNQVDGLPPA